MKQFTSILTALLLVGCATSGRKIDQAKVDQIKPGMSQAEVSGLIGSPDQVTKDITGLASWVYNFTRATSKAENFIPVVNMFASGVDVKHQSVTVTFTSSGTVSNVVSSMGGTDVSTGLSSGSAASKESMRPVEAGKRAK